MFYLHFPRSSRLNSTGSTDEYFDDEYVASELDASSSSSGSSGSSAGSFFSANQQLPTSSSQSSSVASSYVADMNMTNAGFGHYMQQQQQQQHIYQQNYHQYQQLQQQFNLYQQHQQQQLHFDVPIAAAAYMEARDYLPEFPGQIPQRKKTSTAAVAVNATPTTAQSTTSSTIAIDATAAATIESLAALKLDETNQVDSIASGCDVVGIAAAAGANNRGVAVGGAPAVGVVGAAKASKSNVSACYFYRLKCFYDCVVVGVVVDGRPRPTFTCVAQTS